MDGTKKLIQSDKSSTGYRGVAPHTGQFKAACDTPPCHSNHLGTFNTLEEGAQAYLQHLKKESLNANFGGGSASDSHRG